MPLFYYDKHFRDITTCPCREFKLLLPAICFLIFAAYLIHEVIILQKYRKSVSLCICVGGTRGKTGVARLIASVLREHGKNVLAKTTGSEPVYVLPDGEIEKITRRGITSILEQKKLLRKAYNLNADCIVSEIMSISPENHIIEGRRLLKPDIFVITNARRDHIDEQGVSGGEIAEVITGAIPSGIPVFIPGKACTGQFNSLLNKNRNSVHLVNPGRETERSECYIPQGLTDNIILSISVAEYLDIPSDIINKGHSKTGGDTGSLKIWKFEKAAGKVFYFINLFAANEPESTSIIYNEILKKIPETGLEQNGILNLRKDRGDRSLLWIESLREQKYLLPERYYVTGAHVGIFKRKAGKYLNTDTVPCKKPEEITDYIISRCKNGGIITGMGNIGGMGEMLVDYWNKNFVLFYS